VPTPETLKFELDGPDVHPANVDTRAALALFLQYLEMLRKLAKHAKRELSFTGLDVKDKCLEFQARPSNPDFAHIHSAELSQYLARQVDIPDFIAPDVRKFRKQIRKFPQELTSTRVHVGERQELVFTAAFTEPKRERYSEQLSTRAVVLRVGVAHPKDSKRKVPVRLSIDMEEPKEVTLHTDLETSRKLGGYILQEVEVSLVVGRDRVGRIVSGEVENFEPLQNISPSTAWRDFYRQAASEWDRVEDIEKELGRD
jgi:hypothetical protein